MIAGWEGEKAFEGGECTVCGTVPKKVVHEQECGKRSKYHSAHAHVPRLSRTDALPVRVLHLARGHVLGSGMTCVTSVLVPTAARMFVQMSCTYTAQSYAATESLHLAKSQIEQYVSEYRGCRREVQLQHSISTDFRTH